MKFSPDELMSAKVWAETNCGEDNPMDLMIWKLLDGQQKQSVRSANYHDREAADASAMMDEISSRFVISPPTGDEDVAPDLPNGDEDVDF